jgi:hypothetical protein
MYTVENISTFAEIMSTVHLNTIPYGSRIVVSVIGVDEILSIFHSKSIVLLVYTIKVVGIILIKKIAHSSLLASLLI